MKTPWRSEHSTNVSVIKGKFSDIISALTLGEQHLKSSKSTQMIVKFKFSPRWGPFRVDQYATGQSPLYEYHTWTFLWLYFSVV